jgi:succinate dehydrogenase / fumarate reductase, iron-sulfur subunit
MGAAAAPGLTQTAKQWVSVGRVEDMPEGAVVMVPVSYEIRSGFYVQRVTAPVMLSRTSDEIVCFKAECPHLGCQVGWDAASSTFRCSCHGGSFDRNGQVLAGPPPRELERYAHKVELGQILVEVG